MKIDHPCKTCVTLAICKGTAQQHNGLFYLSEKCELIKYHLVDIYKKSYNIKSHYSAYSSKTMFWRYIQTVRQYQELLDFMEVKR